jgi:hypothetical protein
VRGALPCPYGHGQIITDIHGFSLNGNGEINKTNYDQQKALNN